LGIGVWGLGVRSWGVGIGVWRFRMRVWGLGTSLMYPVRSLRIGASILKYLVKFLGFRV